MAGSAFSQDSNDVLDATYLTTTNETSTFSNSINLAALPDGFIYNDSDGTTSTLSTVPGYTGYELVTGNITMEPNKIYTLDGAGAYDLTLPVTATTGSMIRIHAAVDQFSILQNAGQSIVFNTSTTTVGAGGSISTTAVGQSIELFAYADDDDWQVVSNVGTFTVV